MLVEDACDMETLADFLRRTPFFGGLADDALNRVIGMLAERSCAPGDAVYREGELGRSMYVVGAGELVVCRGCGSGHMVKLVRLRPGDFFGDTALIAIRPREATVLVEVEARLYELTNSDLYRLYKTDVHTYVMVLQNINRELCRRIHQADARIVQVADELGDEETQIRSRVSP